MANTNQAKERTKGAINPGVAGVTGAVVGAGVGVAAAAAMKDEETKKKVNKVIASAKEQALEYVDSMAGSNTADEGAKGGQSKSMQPKKAERKNEIHK